MKNYRYVITEIKGLYGSNGATITELEFYDPNNRKIGYSTTDVDIYPSYFWWSGVVWDRSNLDNGNTTYVDNHTGSTSTTFFQGNPSPSAIISRFLIDFGTVKSISTINLWAGSPEGRIPYRITFYGTNQYDYTTQIKNFQNNNLTLLAHHDFVGTETSVRLFKLTLTNLHSSLFNVPFARKIRFYHDPLPRINRGTL